MSVDMEQIKQLRDRTGVSVMQCKKALEEAGGDEGKALVLLQKQSSAIASKKADRTLGAGTVAAYIHAGGSVGAMVALSCETDFVGKNEDFKKLAYDIAMHIAAADPKFLSKDDVTEEEKEKVRAAFEKEVSESDKPDDIKEKILGGKVDAYFSEKSLLSQPFIKNPDLTIGALIEGGIQKFGEKIAITDFARFSV